MLTESCGTADHWLIQFTICQCLSSVLATAQTDECHFITQLSYIRVCACAIVTFLALLSCCTDKELVSRYRKSRDTIAALKLRVGFSHHVEVGVTTGHVSQDSQLLMCRGRVCSCRS